MRTQCLPLIGEALDVRSPKASPFQGRWLGEAGTERLSRICDNLSVCFADSVPTTFVPSGHFPPDRGNRPLRGEPLDDVIHISFWSSL